MGFYKGGMMVLFAKLAMSIVYVGGVVFVVEKFLMNRGGEKNNRK